MNILIHSHLFPNPSNPVFGIFVYYFAKALVKLGHNVTVVSPIPYTPAFIPKSSRWWKYRNVPLWTEMDGIKVYYPRFFSIPKRKLFYLRGDLMYLSSTSFYSWLFQRNKFDIIHAHVALPDGVVSAYLSRRYFVPFGVTIHGADLYESIPESKLNFLRIRNVLSNSSFVGVVSNKLVNLLKKYDLVDKIKNLKVVYNGIHIPSEIDKIEWPDKNKNAIRILSVGHAIKRKGYEIVLRALPSLRNRFPNLYYYIIGDGVDLLYFKKIAKELSVDDITFFLGAQPNNKALSYMKHCDVFVLPSWNEAFGIVYIEAMYLGKIVVATENEGISEIIADGENGFLVKPRDVNDFVKKMDWILSNLNKLKKVEMNAQKTVQEIFTWERNAKEYIELYKRVLFKE